MHPSSKPATAFFTAQLGAGAPTTGGTVYRVNKDGSNFQSLYSFRGTGGDGKDPYLSGVVEGADGSL